MTIALLALTLTACGGGGEKETSAPADQPAAQQQKEDSSSDPLEKLMANAKGTTELSFDMIMTANGDNPMSSTTKMYISGEKSRMEMDAPRGDGLCC